MVAEVVGQFVNGVEVVALPCRGSRCGELWSMDKLLSQLVFILGVVALAGRGSRRRELWSLVDGGASESVGLLPGDWRPTQPGFNELGALVAWW